jgi:hypothetical protein
MDADIIIAKHRNGPTGQIKLEWVRDFTTFKNPKSAAAAQDARAKATKKPAKEIK